MPEWKSEIGDLSEGSKFYFPHDPHRSVWTVLASKRKAANGNAVFIYCEDAEGKIIDYNSNRTVMHVTGNSIPEPDIKPDFIPTNNNTMTRHYSHKESSIVIYSTNDYSDFKMINGNRQLNERKINKIINEINSGNDMLCYYPIQVKDDGGRLNILDGQHRFYICKKLKRPVYYILVTEEKSMPDIAKINSNVEKWKPADFINCYVQHGNENYKILDKFLSTYQISLSVALLLLHSGTPGTEGSYPQLTESFRDGTFVVKKQEEAEALANDCMLFSDFTNCRSRAFVIAIYRIKKAGLISIADLVEVYKKRPEMLTQQGNYKAYINTLEQIVNVGKKHRIVII